MWMSQKIAEKNITFLSVWRNFVWSGKVHITVKFLNFRTPENIAVIYLIWICAVCPALSAQKFRIITVFGDNLDMVF